MSDLTQETGRAAYAGAGPEALPEDAPAEPDFAADAEPCAPEGDRDLEGLFEETVVSLPTDDTLQWRAEVLQLVNWGGFEGHTRIELHADATMLSGASGAGKSTILDAYTALLMSSDTRFNGASNAAVAGRARSEGQRNLVSYLRGAVDVIDDPRTGRPVEQLLRGRGVDTWGAVSMTFVNDQGRRFTALRTYYVPRRATRSGDVSMQLVTLDGALELSELEAAVPDRFHANTLKKLSPGLRVHRSYAEFADLLYARLGIGAGGDGAKALRLLARIQAGNQVRSVDELYKEMVLERPATFAAADRAIGHFDDLEQAYAAMRTEEQKQEVLAPITELHARHLASGRRLAELDAYGVTAPGHTPITAWRLTTHRRLLAAAVRDNRAGRARVSAELADSTRDEAALRADIEAARDEHRSSGGAALERLAAEVEQEKLVRTERELRRGVLMERISPLGEVALGTREEFEQRRREAGAWLEDQPAARAELLRRRDEAVGRRYPLAARKAALQGERSSLAGRQSRIPKHLDDLRAVVCDATGFPVHELPFLAELVDVAPEEARWRLAVETVLGGVARQLLVPAHRLEEFSRRLDQVKLRGRITFVAADLDLPATAPQDPDTVAGKLVHRDSPFSGWVQQFVAEPRRNARCVEDPAQLRGGGYRVTLAGQTRQGGRGSHGRAEAGSLLGFSNTEALADLDAALAGVEAELGTIDQQVAELEREARTLDTVRDAHEAIRAAAYDEVDLAASDARIAELAARRTEMLTSEDHLGTLADQVEALEAKLDEVRNRRYALGLEKDRLDTEHARLVEDEDALSALLEPMEDRLPEILSEVQQASLDAEFAAAVEPADSEDLGRFTEHLARLQTRLTEQISGAHDELVATRRELCGIFAAYQRLWPDPNLGSAVESYADFEAILESIRATGLAERRAEWRRRVTQWSGQDLVPLLGTMNASVEEIEDRLEPINAILRRLEFGASKDRLRIRLRKLAPAHVQAFVRELRLLSAGAPDDLTEEQLEARFDRLRTFMARLRTRDDAFGSAELSERDRLLDVRRHVELSAERYDQHTGELRSTYRTLGEKSGGESQELVAFIVGSALRFRLGDELRSRPRFAPVFLDEGFVKADSEFAGRAVRAWKGLGFQLVIGVPLDKVTGLEPHMDELLAVTKNTETNLSSVFRLRDA
ncbi:ATP-binding protein [Nocardioides insulae]|uniref:ATP-binding protein n=1 Tax=Nocardioides insulae TaxID=394734 RepID=UPI0003F80F4D|nr:SbcC/MukB-like Walker B domain-containing protein [Nocardioides insulae]